MKTRIESNAIRSLIKSSKHHSGRCQRRRKKRKLTSMCAAAFQCESWIRENTQPRIHPTYKQYYALENYTTSSYGTFSRTFQITCIATKVGPWICTATQTVQWDKRKTQFMHCGRSAQSSHHMIEIHHTFDTNIQSSLNVHSPYIKSNALGVVTLQE